MVTRSPMAGMPQSTTLVWDQMTGEIEICIYIDPMYISLILNRIVKLSKASIIGQSTFGMKETEGGEFEELQIRDASKAVGEVLSNLKDKTEVDLLHVNCEVRWYFGTNQ